ncbi:MAG: 4Fe-4S dicluster domain-containing protein [Acidobacteria bacterium]|nr:4Fe-4S dicluster domain-containing protein [Acidobacteriota bacterium]
MSISRRGFLGAAAGLSALALAGRSALETQPREPEPGGGTPAAGTRWALVIDPRKCLEAGDCTKCVDVCHTVHNVPAIAEPAHSVKWIWKEPFERTFPSLQTDYPPDDLRDKPVMVLCNHCDNPPCVRVCPTQATWRRDDGIVMMDWHRCIGCRYCMAACPYGSRSFNWKDPRPSLVQTTPDFPTRSKGVVEKCTLCEERLAKGQPLACVAACPAKALVFGNLADPASEVRSLLRSRFTIRRKPELGTRPAIYYIV